MISDFSIFSEPIRQYYWINIAQDRSTWGKVVHAVCGIDGDPAPKNNPKAEYVLEHRPYYATFEDDG